MSYPWPSFGGFKFKREEHILWGSDSGWALAPSIAVGRPHGSATNVITTLAIGSAERTFEINLSVARFSALQLLLNSKAVFTDWGRPLPDSRMAFLSTVTPTDPELISNNPNGIANRKIRTKIALISA